MADPAEAVKYNLHFEDATLSGEVTEDEGGKTRFGLASKYNPDLNDENFYALPVEEALTKAMQIYTERYCPRVDVTQIVDQAVANKIYDMFVNMGDEAIFLVQNCVGADADGHIGPNTLRQINSSDPGGLCYRLCNVSRAYYKKVELHSISIGKPRSEGELKSWDTRARCMGKVGDFQPEKAQQ
jgi:lysozyme family protein